MHAESTKTRARRILVTKQHRARCAALHRAHLLCLLARALAHDRAACDEELQVMVDSLTSQ